MRSVIYCQNCQNCQNCQISRGTFHTSKTKCVRMYTSVYLREESEYIIQSQIPHDAYILNRYSALTRWIPSYHETRTNSTTSKRRRKWMQHIFSIMPRDIDWDTFLHHYLQKLFLKEKTYVLRLNEFPYQVRRCTHYILWCVQVYKDDEVTNILQTILPNKSFVWYHNPKQLIRLPHYHVFVRSFK